MERLERQNASYNVQIETLAEQIAQKHKMIEALTPELERLNALRSESVALESAVEALQVRKSEAQKELDKIRAEIQKTAAFRPELEKIARDEALAAIVADEERRFTENRIARTNLELMRQRGEISTAEYISKLRELTQPPKRLELSE